jgi:hypothetical protein
MPNKETLFGGKDGGKRHLNYILQQATSDAVSHERDIEKEQRMLPQIDVELATSRVQSLLQVQIERLQDLLSELSTVNEAEPEEPLTE